MDPKGLGSGLPTRKQDQSDGKAVITDDVIKAMQERFLKMQMDDPEKFLSEQPQHVQSRVDALKELQNKYEECHNQFLKEVKALQLKYQSIQEPLLTEQREIISGNKGVKGADEGDGGIPNFWVNALVKSYIVGEIVQERDLPVLAFLKDIRARLLPDENGFELIFKFDENNPYFDNTELVKTYIMVDLEFTMLKSAKGTTINWKEGKDVTKKTMRRKVKPGQALSGPQIKVVKTDSFFNFFDPPQLPEEQQDIEQDKLQELQETLESDYEVGATIREKIIPMAVLYYTGDARQLEEEEGLGEDFDEDDDDELDEEDEEDDEGEDKDKQDCKQQ
eukprot:TRINITY_DN2077_c0_g1_i1.p1 TRINITY_DN2077_c0_g1~~TRINITY_DN2077_c0_g1_i1.p1  ORF type:complete len:334 (+),score=61.48 TRINITY_DN2077_c0_g1_i1:134-1135(+)